MSAEKEFLNGVVVKVRENQPDFVLCNLSIRVEDLIATLRKEQSEWLSAVVKRSKGGKYYVEIDRWKPSEKPADVARARALEPDAFADDIPF